MRIINTSVSLEKYPIEKLAYQCLFSVFRDRYKKHSALCMITAIEISDCVLNGGYEQNDMFDVWDFIEKELDKEHGFVPVTVFIESIERPLREINRETRIPLGSLHNYKEQGRKKILKFISQ